MTIAVTTPTGHVGSQVVRMLCQAGVRPRLLLRNPDRLDSELRDRVELAVGDQRLDAAREEAGTTLLHLRCGYFMTNLLMDLDGLRAGRLTSVRRLEDPMPWVDPRDIATVATARLLADDWTGRQMQAVQGPADLDRGRRGPVDRDRRVDRSAADHRRRAARRLARRGHE